MKTDTLTRRDFLRQSTVTGATLSLLPSALPAVHAAGSDELKIGLVGCGGRGTGAATQVLTATTTPVKLWAMGDLVQDRIDQSHRMLSEGAESRYDREAVGPLAGKMDVPPERRFVGFDAIDRVLVSGVDLVLLTTPPGIRPAHFEAAVRAGKHAFIEKPVAVDPVGVRRVIQTAAEAKAKGLSVVAGTQRRHQQSYLEWMRRLHDGAIGEIVGGEVHWLGGGSSLTQPKPEGMSDMEWQCRRWYYHCWLSGDHIVEQHVHNLDVMNWALGATPVSALGMGSRAVREGGDIWDNFTVEYEFASGVRITSMCRQITGCMGRIAERFVGTQGTAYCDGRRAVILGPNRARFQESRNPYVQEHADLIDSIRNGQALNEGVTVAESTLTAVMGRMAAYSGQRVEWDWLREKSQLDLVPARLEFGPRPEPVVPLPGRWPLV